MAERSATAPASQSFDGFELVRPLGQGGMGTVWLGRDAVLDRPVALKFLSATSVDEARARMLLEARALARLHHANVASVYRVGEVDDHPYIAYEYVDGISLAAIERPVEWPKVLTIALGIARGLAAVHRQGVLHRDIKPANVVLTRAGEPKLIDFGIAKLRHPSGVGGASAAAGRTLAGAAHALGDSDLSMANEGYLAGTPLYMAPELWQGLPATEGTDLYALGLILHELLVGSLPHAKLHGDALIARILTLELPHPRALCPTIPPALADLVARLTRPNPSDRCRHADEVCDALEVIRALYRASIEAAARRSSDDAETLLRTSFELLSPRRAEIGSHFYAGLFARHPELRPLFPADMSGQEAKLVGALELVVQRFGAREVLVPFLEDLGRRHADYGVVPAHFEAVGVQLLETLSALAGPAWTDPLRRAWADAYDGLAHVMVRGLTRVQADFAATEDVVPPTLWNLPVGPPATRYARNGPVSIAYQVIGSGALDLVVIPGFVSHLEAGWESPVFATYFRRLASFARVILIDKRGTGLSDRVLDAISLDDQIDDVAAVLDAVGTERAAIFGHSLGGVLAQAFAARRPERVRALLLFGSAARSLAADDFPQGLARDVYESWIRQVREQWGASLFIEGAAPSLAGDATFRDWWSRYLRAGASPGAAETVLRRMAEADVRGLLGSIAAPTLILHRSEDRLVPITSARATAAAIPGALFRELPGADHLPAVGDTETHLGAVRDFLAGLPPPAGGRGLATLMVASGGPELAARLAQASAAESALEVDREALTAEFRTTLAAVRAARALVTTARSRGAPIRIAIVSGPREAIESGALRELAAAELASITDGQVRLDPLSLELCRGGRVRVDASWRVLEV
ncbi:MAG: alpha/beta fold hydrolase [Nannocystaceae bacterium]